MKMISLNLFVYTRFLICLDNKNGSKVSLIAIRRGCLSTDAAGLCAQHTNTSSQAD